MLKWLTKPLVFRLFQSMREIARLKKKLTHRKQQIHELQARLAESDRQRSVIMEELLIQNRQADKLRIFASRDPLTDLLNRRGFERASRRQVSNAQRHARENQSRFLQPFVVLLDLDGLKAVNDTYGHPKGDDVLLIAAEILLEVFNRGDSDIVCRLGGDEFIILLSDAEQVYVVERSELLRKKIAGEEQLRFPVRSITASIGVAMVNIMKETSPDEISESCSDAAALADRAMYESKRSGKNQVTVLIGDTFYKYMPV